MDRTGWSPCRWGAAWLSIAACVGLVACQGQTTLVENAGGGGNNANTTNNTSTHNNTSTQNNATPGNNALVNTMPREELPPFSPADPVMRRLTQSEFENTVRDLLGLAVEPPSELEPDTPVNGFSAIGASIVALSPRGVEQYEAGALEMAHQAMSAASSRAMLVPCQPSSQPVDATCARQFVETFGKRAFRRPLTELEISRYVGVAEYASTELNDFYAGLEFVIAAMLQSPNFIYRIEYGQPDPQDPSRRKLDGYEIATRMSYLLWNTTPDDQLLAAAAAGELDTPEGIRAQARRLLDSPRARGALRAFWIEYLHIDKIAQVSKDQSVYPMASPTLYSAMREETLRLLDHIIFTEQGDFRKVFDTRTTFVNKELAQLYGLQLEREPVAGEFIRAEHPESSLRRGILSHASVLTVNAHPVSTSTTHRGKFVRESVLCQTIPAPPNNINTDLPAPEPESGILTLRQRMESYAENPQCAGCHRLLDPIGFAFENFDAVGRYRTEDNAQPVDPSGSLDGAEFDDFVGFAAAVRDHRDTMRCLVKKAYRYATGRVEGDGEKVVIYDLLQAFEQSGWNFKELLVEVVVSDGFRYTR